MKKHAFRIGLVVTMLLGLMTISANAACEYTNPHATTSEETKTHLEADGWTQLTDTHTTLQDGMYYLNDDVTNANKIEVIGEVTICLNGHKLDLANATTTAYQQMVVIGGGTLHICDCHDTDAAGSITSSVAYSSSSTKKVNLIHTSGNNCQVHLWNGSLTGVKSGNGGSAVRFNGTGNLLHIHGGKITSNAERAGTGGGAIYFYGANNTLEMCDGAITGNATTGHGGAILTRSTGNTINISGGTISNNTTSSSGYGGAIRINGSSSTAGGAKVTLSGDVQIIDNNKSTGSVNHQAISFQSKVSNSELNISGNVKVTGTIGGINYPTVTITGGTFDDTNVSTYIDTNTYVWFDNDDTTYTVYKIGEEPGEEDPDDPGESEGVYIHNDGKEWFPLTATTVIEADKLYYLADETVAFDATLLVDKNITICLHGHTLSSSASDWALKVDAGSTLTLEDCTTTGTITTTAANSRGLYLNDGTVTMTGGIITGFNGSNQYGAGVYVQRGGNVFNMSGGKITGNGTSGTTDGAGIYAISGTSAGKGGVINLSGTAEVSNNKGRNGGGIYAGLGTSGTYSGAVLNMTGGTISGNTASGNGGGVYLNGQNNGTGYEGGQTYAGKLVMSGGTISGNIASGDGGGVYANRGRVQLSGTAQIETNNADNGGGVGLSLYSKMFMEDGAITGNTAATYGGGVGALGASARLELSGGAVSGNTANYGGGLATNATGTIEMSGGAVHGNLSASAIHGVGVYIYKGTFNMTGGKIGLKADGTTDTNKHTSDTQPAGSSVIATTDAGAANAATVTISGGELYAATGATGIVSATNSGVLTISEGVKLSHDPTGYFDEAYQLYKLPSNDPVPYTVAAKVTEVSSSVGLGNSLAMNFYIPGLPGAADDYDVTVNGNEATMVKDGDNFKVTYTGVAAKDMADEITLTITNNENPICDATDSIKDYADRVLADADASEELKTAVADMLHYGAAAQTYFETGDALVNDGVTGGSADVTITDNSTVPEAAKNLYMGSSVSLKDNIIVNLYFASTVESVTMNGGALALEEKDGYKVAVIDDITLPNASTAISFTINESVEVEDSIQAYAYRAQHLASEADGLSELCQAMINFVASVNALQ